MNWFIKTYRLSKQSESIFILFLIKNLYYAVNGIKINAHHLTEIKNISNIITQKNVNIGIDYFGFSSKHDRSYLNIRGKLVFNGNFSIGKGCRFDIGPNAIAEIGDNGYVSPNTWFVISHGLSIGNNCAISWGCQFLDDDFHTLEYGNQKQIKNNKITIGNNVWIGCNSFIYKGVNIPNGCVIASNSVVKSSFFEENTLIAGNPAVVIKKNVTWKD
jgi:acetyltransferase-like isoleucine patch superfamily enzyme